MNKNDVTINELVSSMASEMRRLGYSEMTVWGEYVPRMTQIRKYYHETGHVFYNLDVTAEYTQLQKARREKGEIGSDSYHKSCSVANRMNEFFLTGTLRVISCNRGSVYVINEQNERLIDLFLASRSYSDKSRRDAEWVIRRYLNYWEQKGYTSISEVSVDEVRDFIVETSMEVKPASLYNILLYLKYFHKFLRDSEIPAPDCVSLFSYRVYRDMHIQGYVTDEELEKILSVIDTSTELGKRNRAIILLGATTGLRACDIIHMKLTDINWRRGEICLKQAKTGDTVCVPLVRETSEAIQDYILNARPCSTGCQEVFLRDMSPRTAIQDGASITSMFKSYQKKAGIIRQPFDGKGFHGLRRRLAKKLLVSGSSLTMITQILGHEDIQSSRQYLSLNTDNLKECALSLEGIHVERRALL